MAFIVEQKPAGESQFVLMDEGFNNAVISEIKDLGMVPVNPSFLAANREKAKKEGKDPSKVKTQERKCRIIYKGDGEAEAAETLTVSLHDKATLAKRVKSLTGTAPGQKFDLETLVGTPVTVQIEHYVKQNGYDGAKVVAVARRKEAKAAGKAVVKTTAPAAAPVTNTEITDDDIAF